MRTVPLQSFILAAAFGVVSCSGSEISNPPGVGGEASVGGSGDTGGDTSAGGSMGIGGVTQSGGAVGTGGRQTGGLTGAGGNIVNTGGMLGTGGARTGGAPGNGGTPATGGVPGAGGVRTGGAPGNGGTPATGGTRPNTGGAPGNGGTPATGGTFATNTGGTTPTGTGGMPGTGGAKTGGAPGTGGAATGGTKATGGAATGGSKATGGAATGGAKATGGGTSSPPNCSGTMPTGGTQHSGNSQGTAAGLSWQLWSNGSGGTITTFSTPAFGATWNNSGDFLARIGLTWNNTKTYDQLGTVTAQFAETKTGTAGGYSYIGIYGWSVSPCIEWYIVDDSFKTMPVNPGSTTNKGTATIDGGTYNLYTRSTTGTGGSNCGSSVTSWNQFYSIRTTARQCGQISITEHFKAWANAGMTLGKMNEAQVIVEVGGGVGSINFSTANVTAQ